MKRNNIIVGSLLIVLSLYFNCGAFLDKIESWPGGKIPYTISKSFSLYDRLFIESCMDEWETKTNVDFQHYRGRDEDFYVLRILRDKNENEPSSAATIGYCFEPVIILGVLNRAVVIHELGHVMGLQHEHQRPDRDKYIKIIYKNIEQGALFCFEKNLPEDFLYDYKKFPYDYSSIMHYYEYSFSKNGGKVIISFSFMPLGNSVPSDIDLLKINEIYPKLKKEK
jgi:hypothetical protein